MNKVVYLLIAGILVAPGCFKRSKKAENGSNRSTYEKTGHKSVFDEDVESFILEDDLNPFAPQGGDSVQLVDENGIWSPGSRQTSFETVYYDFDRSDIRQDQKNVLDRSLNQIKHAVNQGQTIIIEGHACTSGGSAQYNMTLSEHRARSVKKYLVSKGVRAASLKIVGRGSEMCKVAGGNQEQQAPNRRVEFYEMATVV